MEKLTYTNVNGYLIPNITYKSGNQMEQLGKYGFLRRDYLKNHRNSTYQVMLLQDTIGEHLLEVDKAAREREEVILKQLEEKEPLPDKEKDQMAWVRAANQHRAIAEEIILKELIAPYGYRLGNGELVIAEDEVEIIQMIFDRYIHTNDGINGVANYLNNHGYTKKLRQNGTIPGFSASFIKKIIDNPVYMGKIAYERRRTEKKTGTRNETHVVEQSDFPVYEEIHEAIISEEDWELAQEKRSKNNYRREKVHDPEHAHILSGILKCPCCGNGMYGNIAKAGRKDNKTRYYYYCKNTVNATGHKCTFRRNIKQSQIDDMLAKLITAMTKEGKFKDAIQDKIGATVDTTDLEKQLSVLNASLHQAETIKTRLEQQMDNLDVTDTHYDKKYQIYRDDWMLNMIE